MNTLLKAKKRLLDFRVKPSVQRLVIMEYLMTNKKHPTADMIFNDLFPKIPTLSKTTVYNTVKLLAENGAILSLDIDERTQRYDGDISEHAHFRCTNCGLIRDIWIKDLHVSFLEHSAEGFLLNNRQLYYKGLCPKCKKLATRQS